MIDFHSHILPAVDDGSRSPGMSLDMIRSLSEQGVLMQSNAGFFLSLRTRRKALKLLRDGRIHLLGSDAHNMNERAPHMAEAARIIRRRGGQSVLDEIDARGRALLGC